MKYISIKEFQRNLYDSIKELPIIITKNDQPFLKVESFSQERPEVKTIRPVISDALVEKLIPPEVKKILDPVEPQFSDVKRPGYHFIPAMNKYGKD